MKKFLSRIFAIALVAVLGVAQLSAQSNVIHVFGKDNKYETINLSKDTRIEFETLDNTKLLNIVDITPFSFKFQVNMPDSVDWIMALADRDIYEQMKLQFGQNDAGFLESIGSVHYKGPQTIEIKDGDYWYTETDWDGSVLGDMTFTIKPGSAFVLLISAAEYKEVPNTWPITYRWIPCYTMEGGDDDWVDDDMGIFSEGLTLGEYSEICTDPGITFTHEYAKQCFWTDPAEVAAEGVEVTLTKLTERTAIFEMYPPENCLSYHVLPLSDEDYTMLIGMVGEAGIQSYVLNYGEPMAGGNEYTMSGLVAGAKYHMMVTGLFEESGAVQSFYHETFSPQVSTLPVPELVVTDVPEKNTHDKVYFNIKCPTKDAYAVKYIANYVKDWIPEINSGYSYEDMVEMYGQILSDSELADVNSDAGYELYYTSYEDVATRLAVIAYNDDEKASKAFWADSKAGALPAKTKVESTLYADLEGDWVLNYWDTQSYISSENSNKTGQYRKFQTSITTNPDFGPATFEDWKGDASYEFVLGALGNNEARVKNLFNEYKSVAAYHKDKYAGQNQIVGVNFPCGYYVKASAQNVFTPWDLFTSEYYSAYDSYELFYDFGPKVFFEVKDANTIVLKSDMAGFAPLESFDGTYYMVGVGKNGSTLQYLLECEFPVTISEDKNTLTVNPVVVDGISYYPATVQYNYGYAYPQNVTDRALIYTRGKLEDSSVAAAKKMAIDNSYKLTHSLSDLAIEGYPIKVAKAAKRVRFGEEAAPKQGATGLFDLKSNVTNSKK